MFDHLPNDPIHHFNSKNGSYESWVPSKPRKPAERYDLYSHRNNNNDDGIQLRQVDSGETESGVNSPPLWNNIIPPPESPASRLQAIVNGQKELMDMVKKMPESHYELTLKDLVDEQTKLGNSQQEECLLKGKEDDQLANGKMDSRKSSGRKEKDSKRVIGRTNSMESNNNNNNKEGLFLKMVFPFGMKKKSKKKKNQLKSSGSAKISPKTEYGDKDWLKKMFSSGSDGSRSSSQSTRNGSTGSDKSNTIRTRRGFFCSSFLPCFQAKGKSAE